MMRLAGQNLRCVRAGREVFAGLDFEVKAGEAVAVVGPNGAGKTSLLRLIAGLIMPADGTIALDGGDAELSVAEQAHYLGHRDAMKPALTVTENLGFWAEFLGGVASQPVAALEAVGLGHAAQLPAGFLSAGQRRRLSIARLLTIKRPIWLLDEPTASLDPDTADWIRQHLETYRRSHNATILLASHNMLEVERLCDRVIIMKKGRIEDDDSPDGILQRYNRTTLEDVFLDVARGRNRGELQMDNQIQPDAILRDAAEEGRSSG